MAIQKIKALVWVLFVVLMLGSCKPENTERLPEPAVGNLIKTSLVINSEISPFKSLSSAPTPTQDIIAVQVFTLENGAKFAYARGLFSTIAQIPEIDLYDNKQYAIETTIVVDGQNTVAKKASDGSFYRPFTTGAAPQKVTNAFQYTTISFNYLSTGDGDIMDADGIRATFSRPLWARYYGYSDGISPSTQSSITVTAKRVYAALALQAKGLTEGKLEIALDQAPLIELPSTINNKDTTIFISLAGSRANTAAWIEDGYSEDVACSITHIDAKGIRTPVTSAGTSISIKRNYIHPITIDLNNSGQAIISIESGPMIEDDEIIFR